MPLISVVVASAFLGRAKNKGAIGRQMVDWEYNLEQKWAALHFGEVKVKTEDKQHGFEIQVYDNDLDSDVVQVELYADGAKSDSPVRQTIKRVRQLAGSSGGYAYSAAVSAVRPLMDCTARVIPHCDGVAVLLEDPRILCRR